MDARCSYRRLRRFAPQYLIYKVPLSSWEGAITLERKGVGIGLIQPEERPFFIGLFLAYRLAI
jgi:hypothetical protein